MSMSMTDDSDLTAAPGSTPGQSPPAASAPVPRQTPGAPAGEKPPAAAAAPPATDAPPAPEMPPAPEAPPRETLVDAIADLLQMFVNWMRAEASDIVRDKVVLPVQQLGLTLASASAAGCLFVIGMSFLFVALLLVLAAWLGWPGALALVGAVILIGAGIFTYLKMRSIQK